MWKSLSLTLFLAATSSLAQPRFEASKLELLEPHQEGQAYNPSLGCYGENSTFYMTRVLVIRQGGELIAIYSQKRTINGVERDESGTFYFDERLKTEDIHHTTYRIASVGNRELFAMESINGGEAYIATLYDLQATNHFISMTCSADETQVKAWTKQINLF